MHRLLALLFVLIAGCVTLPDRDYRHAVHSQQKGDWSSARESWARAVAGMDTSQMSMAQQAVYHYEYGRTLGVTCHFDEAERELLEAYRLDAESDGPAYMSLSELARLNLEQRKFAEAAIYFERMLNETDEKELEQSPAEHAAILDEFSAALTGAGDVDHAAQVHEEAMDIRRKHPDAQSITDRTPYGSQCE